MSSCSDNIPPYVDCGCPEAPVYNNEGCLVSTTTECVTYVGADLACIGRVEGTPLGVILRAMDTKICQVTGGGLDYAGLNLSCISGVSTQGQFAEAIAAHACATRSTLNSFISTTNSTLNGIITPNLTGCTYLGITSASNYQQIMQAFATKICNLDTRLSLNGVAWSQCITTSPAPTTIAGGFSALINQICILKNSIDNSGGGDTFKVKTSAGDLIEGYLEDKLANSTCISWEEVGDTAVKQMRASLSFTPKQYTFDPTFFHTVTLPVDGGCVQEIQISLKSAPPGGASYELTCEKIKAVIQASRGTGRFTNLYGSDSTDGSCRNFTPCEVRNTIFDGYSAGDYVVRVTPAASTECAKITLVTAPVPATPSNTCWNEQWTFISAAPTGTDAGTGVSWAQSQQVHPFPATIPIAPDPVQYKFKSNGLLTMRGTMDLTIHQTEPPTSGTGYTGTFRVTLADIPTGCIATTKNKIVPLNNRHFGDAGEVSQGHISAYLEYDIVSKTLQLITDYSVVDATTNIIVLFDGVAVDMS